MNPAAAADTPPSLVAYFAGGALVMVVGLLIILFVAHRQVRVEKQKRQASFERKHPSKRSNKRRST